MNVRGKGSTARRAGGGTGPGGRDLKLGITSHIDVLTIRNDPGGAASGLGCNGELKLKRAGLPGRWLGPWAWLSTTTPERPAVLRGERDSHCTGEAPSGRETSRPRCCIPSPGIMLFGHLKSRDGWGISFGGGCLCNVFKQKYTFSPNSRMQPIF